MTPSQALLAGFVKTTLVHRHAFIPSLKRTYELGREARLSLELPACPAADAAIAAGRWSQARRKATGPLAGVLALFGGPARGRTLFERMISRYASERALPLLDGFWLGLARLRRCELSTARFGDGFWDLLARSERGRVDIEFGSGLADCDRALALEPRNAWAWAFRSRIRFQAAPGKDGLADLDRAVELSPSEGWIRAWRGDARRKLGDLRGALEDLRAARRLEPSYDRTYLWLGKTLQALGRLEEARGALDEGIALCPYFEKAYAQRSQVLRRLGRMEQALRDLRYAASINHRHNWLGSWTAVAAPLTGDQVRDLELLARYAVKRRRGLGWLGESLVQAGRFEEGLEVLRRAPRSAWTRVWEGEALVRLGRLEEAERALRSPDPDYGRGFAWRGRLRLLRGDRKGAAADFDRAVGDALVEYSWLYYWRGLARRDRRDLETAAALEPHRREFREALA